VSRLRTLVGWSCAAVALGALLVGWLQPPPDLTRADAREVAERALDHVGVRRATVAERVEAGRFLRDDEELIPVWRARATVEGFDGTVMLEVDRDDGSLVHLDDRSTDQSTRLLSDEQFDRFDGYATNPAQDRRLQRNLLLALAAAAAACAAVALATLPDRKEP
jgi:hypothetical protein